MAVTEQKCQERAMPEMEKPLSDDRSLARETSDRGFCNAIKHGERIARLGELKKRARAMSSYIKDLSDSPLDIKLSSDVAACSTWLVFNNYYTVDQIRLSKARTCKKHLLCPVCARIRAIKQAVKYMERLEQVLADKPNLTPALLTLTVKNGEDLTERFQHLQKSWRKYQDRRRDWKKKGVGFNEGCSTKSPEHYFEKGELKSILGIYINIFSKQ